MQGAETSAASNAEEVAHERTAVERCFAWSGLVPLPVFLCLHLVRELDLAYVTDTAELVRPAPGTFSQLSGVLLVWLPLAVHVALGVWLTLGGQKPRPRPNDVPPLARRISGLSAFGALAFVLYHASAFPLAALRDQADHVDASFRLIGLLSSTTGGVPLHGALYLLGLLATTTHAALGVHRGLVSEGMLREPASRQRSARLCAAFGALGFALGAAAVIRVATGGLLR